MSSTTATGEAIERDFESFDNWPGGWPDEVEAAVVDSLCSAKARCGNDATTGVRVQVAAWRAYRGRGRLDETAVLVEFPGWNATRTRPPHQRVGGRLKANVIGDVAARFAEAGLWHAADVIADACRAKKL